MNPLRFSAPFCITPPRNARWTVGPAGVSNRLFAIIILACLTITGPVLAAEKLGSAVIRNSSAYGPSELFEVYKPYLGRTVTEQTATAIAEALQQRYLDDGYSRPGYDVGDRGITSGIVRINLVEPTISRVAISGDTGPYRDKLDNLVANLPSDRSLRPQEIRDAMREVRRFPGLDVSVATEPDGQHHGGFILTLDSAYKPFEGSVKLSNRGTREIGRDILFAQVVANGIFSREITGGLFVTSAKDSENYRGGGLFAKVPLGAGGTFAQLQGAVTALSYNVQDIHVRQNRDKAAIQLTHPLLRQSTRDLSIWGGFKVEDLDVAYDGSVNRQERLRSIEAGSTLTWRSEQSQYLLSTEVEQGLNGFGSGIDIVNAPDDPRGEVFSIARLRYVRLAPLNDRWSWRLDAYAQTSPHVLPSIKRFKVGGGRIGRGFETAAISGDRGVGGKTQLTRRVWGDATWIERADLYGFYDLGSAWRNDAEGRESASSTGFGASLRDGRLSGYLEIARPLTHADADGRKNTSIFAEVSFRF
jgi:hemolysin activation/secretion protein